MRKLLALALVLAPSLVAADKSLARGSTWDCKKDPVVSIGNGDGTYKFKGACKKITIAGGENRVTIDSVEMLDVPGGENKVNVGTVGSIDVGGADNQITWKKAKTGDAPSIKDGGTGNKIAQKK